MTCVSGYVKHLAMTSIFETTAQEELLIVTAVPDPMHSRGVLFQHQHQSSKYLWKILDQDL
jgi:hypothetical protein